MKAYYVDIKDDPGQGANIVFSNSVREARKHTGDLDYDSWLDVQCRLLPDFRRYGDAHRTGVGARKMESRLVV